MKILVQRLFLISPFILLFMIGCTQPHPASHYPEPFYGQLLMGDSLMEAEPQQKSEREFVALATVVKQRFTVSPDSATDDTPAEIIMEKPVSASVDDNEEYLFLMDQESQVINKYAITTDELIDVFNYASENKTLLRSASLLSVRNGELWLSSGGKQKPVLRLNQKGEFLGFIDNPHRGGVSDVAPGKYLQYNLNEPALFHVHNENGKREHSFGVLASERKHLTQVYKNLMGHGLGFSGDVKTDGKGTFVYSSFYGGGLLGYNIDGTLRYFRETVDHNAFPPTPFMEGNGGSKIVDMDSVRTQQMPINVWNGVFYQYVNLIGEKKMVVDAYAYDTGDYLYSLPVNWKECGYIFITDDHIYANCKEGFVQLARPARETELLVSAHLME